MRGRRAVAWGIVAASVLFWFPLIAGAVEDAGATTAVRPIPTAGVPSETRELWYAVFMDLAGKHSRAGYMRFQRETLPDRIRLVMEMELEISEGGQALKQSTFERTDLTPTGDLISFEKRTVQPGAEVLQRGVAKDHDLIVDTTAGGRTTTRTIHFEGAPRTEASAEFAFAKEGMKPGAKLRVPVVDPRGGELTYMDIEITREVPCPKGTDGGACFETKETMLGLEVVSILDARGDLLSARVAFLDIERSTREDALGKPAGPAADLTAVVSVRPTGVPLPAGGATFARYRLRGTGVEKLALADFRQAYAAPDLTVTVGPPDAPAPSAPETAALLAPTPLIQSDAPEIRAVADAAAKDAADAPGAALLLHRWVFEHLRKKSNATSLDSALQVLRDRQGDCLSHSVLLTALLRARGIPAKVVAGLVYFEGAFRYHAWVYAYAGRWMALDPTLDRVPPDAEYIRLADEETGDVSWLNSLADFAVEVLEAR